MNIESFTAHLPRMTNEQLGRSIVLAKLIGEKFADRAQICVDGCCNDNFQPIDPNLSRSWTYRYAADLIGTELDRRSNSPNSFQQIVSSFFNPQKVRRERKSI